MFHLGKALINTVPENAWSRAMHKALL